MIVIGSAFVRLRQRMRWSKFVAQIKVEVEKWGKVVKGAGMKVE